MNADPQLPAWDLSTEYPDLNSPLFTTDVQAIERAADDLCRDIESLRPFFGRSEWSAMERERLLTGLAKIQETQEAAVRLFWNLSTFVRCELSTDVGNEAAQKALSRLQSLSAKLEEAFEPARLFLLRAPVDVFDAFLAMPAATPSRFRWEQQRRTADLLLSEAEESLLIGLWPDGHKSWGRLYENLSGAMRCQIRRTDGSVEVVGLAQAQAMTKLPQEDQRRGAWLGIQEAWSHNQEAASAILNALAGWRLELAKKRSLRRKIDFLEEPLNSSRLGRETLEAMFAAVAEGAPAIRQGARLMAKAHGKKQLDPWDLLAPAPVEGGQTMSFAEGVATIRDSFAAVDSSMGEFVDKMVQNRWIEARVLPQKGGGAYCTRFPKSGTPRVFQTYMGSFSDVSTLAHELGHAYHNWMVRDLPLPQQMYPMTLAETASIFCETALVDRMATRASDNTTRLEAAYADVENAVSLLLNIPARFDFEKSFYEKRASGMVTAGEMSELTDAAWTKWYGDSLSANDRLFWATKMHFSFADVSFYNFPYTFGYLFALSIYARREELGAAFLPKYIEILRDTGRMTVEDLIRKHFDEDAASVAFWRKSVDVVQGKVGVLESLLG